ncbi:MAG: NF038104 family lipoprotein [Pseudomonadota bacterium]
MLNRVFFVALIVMMTSGCTAIAVVDAAASTAVGVGKVAVKGATAAAGALIPDDDEDEKKKK